jgi:hypothetical protein
VEGNASQEWGIMSIIYDYAACLFAALMSGTVLLTAGATGILVSEASAFAFRRRRELATVRIG